MAGVGSTTVAVGVTSGSVDTCPRSLTCADHVVPSQ
jgi:hypothetical protein